MFIEYCMEDTGVIVLKRLYLSKAERLQTILLAKDAVCKYKDVRTYVLCTTCVYILYVLVCSFRTKQYRDGLGPQGPYRQDLRIWTMFSIYQGTSAEF